MKKFFKVFFIALGSLLGLVLILAGVALWLIFTPSRLTPIVEKQLPKFVDCRAEVGRVKLTLFSTFPQFGIDIDGLTIINPMKGAQSDTLLDVRQFRGAVDIKALLKRDEIILSDISLADGLVNAFIGLDGKANFDIFPTDDTVEETPEDTGGFGHIDADDLKMNNIDISYIDTSAGMKAEVAGLSGRIKGSVKGDAMDADIDLEPMDVAFEYTGGEATDANSGESSPMRADLKQLSLKILAAMEGDALDADIKMPPSMVSFHYGGEHFLREATVGMDVAAVVDLAQQSAAISIFNLSVNGLRLDVSGNVTNDTTHNSIATDLAYKFDRWPVKELMAMVPASMASYFKGIEADGLLSSEGTVRGEYLDPVSMPLIDAAVVIENADVKYPEMLPFPLSGVNGNFSIYTDLTDDKISYLRINNIEARTPESSLSATGLVSRLFSDPRANLNIDADLQLEELATMLPDDMDADMKGRVAGKIKADAALSELTGMKLDRVKVSGLLSMSGIDVTYNDSLMVRSPNMTLDFSLPNHNAGAHKNMGFAAAKVTADTLDARMTGLFEGSMRNAVVEVETSDVRDTTVFPAMMCRFGFDALAGRTDSMSVSVARPSGSISLSTSRRRADKPKFDVEFNSGEFNGTMNGEKIFVEKMDVKAGVTYDELQKDLLLRWLPRGSFEMENGSVETSMLPYPVRIPAVEMDFTPREFNIGNAGLIIGDTDFSLSGTLTDILPYFRGDTTLKGEFDFTSSLTDIGMLMALTDGIGSDEPEKATEPIKDEVATAGRAYMVPKGIDVVLHTDIKQALWQSDTLSDVRGDVVVLSDGTLMLDDITLTSPATDMEISAKYRTERENHIFVGLGLHLLNVEIPELLHMIPDLDTIMPMLSSFGGRGEFHIVAETYVDSTYTLKMSTLRGAASVRGNDFVLMDGETFGEIAKMLRFNKKTENKVDSLAAEFTVFRDQIDVYPFLVVMDKYKVVVGGRHNTNMSFDYNLSLVESPLPVRLSLNVSGTIDDLNFKLIKNPYKEFYRPASRKVVEGQQLQLRNMIRESMIKPEEDD